MDIQLKRGLLDVCVLTAIKNGESYGYKIIKDVKPYIEMSESTLYTILKRLELSEMLTVRSAEHGADCVSITALPMRGLQESRNSRTNGERSCLFINL